MPVRVEENNKKWEAGTPTEALEPWQARSELLQCDPTAIKGQCYVWALWPHGSVPCGGVKGRALAMPRLCDRFHLECAQIPGMFW